MNETPRREKAKALWDTNESLLQNYRALSMTSQSFLLTVGAIVASAESDELLWFVVVGLFFTLGQVHLWYVWVPITRARGRIVDFYKYQYVRDLDETRLAELTTVCDEGKFVHNASARAQIMSDFFGQSKDYKFPTRWKMDTFMPMMFASAWILLMVWVMLPSLYKHL